MCRWITLISSRDISLSDVVLAPSNSLVQLSRDASFHPGYDEINNAQMNGDGFGVGWYHSNFATLPIDGVAHSHDGSRDTRRTNGHGTHVSPVKAKPPVPENYRAAAIFKDVFPAWNNQNLREICMSTSSNCIMAHVRAASKGTGVSHQNCHPFKIGRLLFCHNGRVQDFQKLRRRFLAEISDEAFDMIRGTTDSELAFALVLTNLAKDGLGSPIQQKTPFGAKRLVSALKRTLHQIERILEEAGIIDGYSTCNYSITDGETMVVTRYCDKSPDVPPPSLYFAFGKADTLYEELTNEQQAHIFMAKQHTQPESDTASETGSVDSDGTFEERQVLLDEHESLPGTVMGEIDAATASFIVASNPLTRTHTWHKMPRNSIMWCTRGSHPELRLLKRRTSPV